MNLSSRSSDLTSSSSRTNISDQSSPPTPTSTLSPCHRKPSWTKTRSPASERSFASTEEWSFTGIVDRQRQASVASSIHSDEYVVPTLLPSPFRRGSSNDEVTKTRRDNKQPWPLTTTLYQRHSESDVPSPAITNIKRASHRQAFGLALDLTSSHLHSIPPTPSATDYSLEPLWMDGRRPSYAAQSIAEGCEKGSRKRFSKEESARGRDSVPGATDLTTNLEPSPIQQVRKRLQSFTLSSNSKRTKLDLPLLLLPPVLFVSHHNLLLSS